MNVSSIPCVTVDSRNALECDTSRFQSDEHAPRGHHDTLLWAKSATAHKDEYLRS